MTYPSHKHTHTEKKNPKNIQQFFCKGPLVLKMAKHLKAANGPLSRVYSKEDVHPVVRREIAPKERKWRRRRILKTWQ